MKDKKYWDQVGYHDNMEAIGANPDHLAIPDPVEELADKSLLHTAVRNLKEPYQSLVIEHLGLFGRHPMSIRQLAEKYNRPKSHVFSMYKKAQSKVSAEFFRLLHGGRIDEGS